MEQKIEIPTPISLFANPQPQPLSQNPEIYAIICSRCGDYSILAIPQRSEPIGWSKTQKQLQKLFGKDRMTQCIALSAHNQFKQLAASGDRQGMEGWLKDKLQPRKQPEKRTACRQSTHNPDYKYADYSINLTKTNQPQKSQQFYRVKNGRKLISDRNPTKPGCDSEKSLRNPYQNTQPNTLTTAANTKKCNYLTIHDANAANEQKATKPTERYKETKTKTQSSVHSKSKRKRWSIDIFAADAIKARAKRQNTKLLKKEKQSQLKLYDAAMSKLKLARSITGGKSESGARSSGGKVPWGEIAQISNEIVKFHEILDKGHHAIMYNQGDQPAQDVQTHNNHNGHTKQLQNNSQPYEATKIQHEQAQPLMQDGQDRVQLVWQKVNKDMVPRMDPIGQAINQTLQAFRQYRLSGLKQLFLLYKKFFYMRTALLSSLCDPTQPLIPEITGEQWSAVCGHPLHRGKTRELEEENESILKFLQKMQKRVQEKHPEELAQRQQIWQLVISEEDYPLFAHTMITHNATAFITLYECLRNKGRSEADEDSGVLMGYGRAILLAGLDEVQGDRHGQVLGWLQQCRRVEDLVGHLRTLAHWCTGQSQ